MNCEHCFKPISSNNRAEKRFCSEKCGERAKKRRHRSVDYTWQTHEPASCRNCSTPLPVPRCKRVTTCSRRCSYAVSNKLRNSKPQYKIAKQAFHNLKEVLDAKDTVNGSRLSQRYGCSTNALRAHFRQFLPPDTHLSQRRSHGLVIDHIVPLSQFTLTDPTHLRISFHYLNLRLITADQNRRKAHHIDWTIVPPEYLLLLATIGIGPVTD